MKLPISVIVLTYNEEDNIRDCLESVQGWADELFIVDSGSNDKTMEIAREYTDKIYTHPFKDYADQRNWVQSSLPIKNEWIFHLDADERVSRELIAELEERFHPKIDIDGFMMSRKTIFRNKWIKHGGHYPVYHLRIFKKSKGRCEERLYDQHFIVDGKIEKVKGDIINIIEPDLRLLNAKQRKWAHSEAREILLNKKRTINVKFKGTPIERRNWFRYNIYYAMPLFIRPTVYFLYRFVIRLGFLDGPEGLIFHFWQGLWYRFLVDREIFRMRTRHQYISGNK
ncbi:MAG: hypothetical protein A2Z72_05720 [Omnitrophica bacterium RBG_13_46_9]|nr:MAG: hypothetical protein A2Z72_05720 [Omnitrophica bacterium RBG_13_46_9]